MNTLETSNRYAADAFKFRLYNSLDERNNLHGNNFVLSQPVQRKHQDAFFTHVTPSNDISKAPKDYYFDLRTGDSKSAIGPMNVRPNLYNDNVSPYTSTFERPSLYKSWEPFTTTPINAMKGERVRFIPHAQPCEVAPNTDSRLWTADPNAELYERRLIQSAEDNPYSNHYRRQGLMSMVALYMKPNNDPYSKKIDAPDDTFCNQLQRNGGVPPATTQF